MFTSPMITKTGENERINITRNGTNLCSSLSPYLIIICERIRTYLLVYALESI